MSETLSGRPTRCLIDHDALRWNLRQIRAQVGVKVKILSMIKANGYGHGAAALAATLAAAGSDGFGVATVEEGVELRAAGVQAPILIVAGIYPDQLEQVFQHRLTPAVHQLTDIEWLEGELRWRGKSLNVHLKIDTGMGRLGLRPGDIGSWLPVVQKLSAVKLEGIFSHFSQAESVAGDYTRRQFELFERTVAELRAQGITAPLVHFANSAAIITLPAAYFDAVRPGIMLYGVYPSPPLAEQVALKPVLSWKTAVLQVKKVPAGTSISYGQTFVTARASVIATLPVGYADGYPRLLSNRGAALVRGQRAAVAGRVCMDLTMLDVTDIKNVQQGDEVVLLGRQGDEEIAADELAGWADTISYEIFTSISARVPRIHQNR